MPDERMHPDSENSFDRSLKELLKDADPAAAGLTFNADRVWNAVEKKKERKIIVWRPWASHAAAVAAGLLIGLYFWQGTEDVKPAATTEHTAIITPEKPTLPTTEASGQPVVRDNSTSGRQLVPKATVVVQQDNRVEKLPAPLTDSGSRAVVVVQKTEIEKLPLPVIAQNDQPRKRKVLHLADMRNENGKATGFEEATNKSFFVKLIEAKEQKEPPTETVSAIVAGYLKKHNN